MILVFSFGGFSIHAQVKVLDTDLTSVAATDTTLASAKAIKTYVDSQITSSNELSELTDVNITSPADGALLFYDTATSKWIDNVVSGDITIADTGVATISSGVIVNADINSSAAIDATKIHDGSVTNTEFGYIGGLTSDAQTQLNAKLENVVEDTTPQLGGNLDLNSNDITGTGDINITGTITATTISNTIGNVVDDTTPQLGGNLDTQSFTVDGRDVSVDGTKLDTIATSATANPNAIDNIVDDSTPQLGGDLDINSNDITGTGNVNITGTITSSGDITTSGVLNSIAPTRHSIRPSLNLDFANSKALDPRITFTRASNATYYDGYTSVKAEENLIYPSIPSSSGYTFINSTLTTNNTTSPDGTTTATLITASSGTGIIPYIEVNDSDSTATVVFTHSIFAKAGTHNYVQLNINSQTSFYANFDLSTGTVLQTLNVTENYESLQVYNGNAYLFSIVDSKIRSVFESSSMIGSRLFIPPIALLIPSHIDLIKS